MTQISVKSVPFRGLYCQSMQFIKQYKCLLRQLLELCSGCYVMLLALPEIGARTVPFV